MAPPPATLETLLGHEAWLRRLVGSLVAGADVDDVLQETWLAALARPPADASRVRHWLARVAKNLALRVRRAAVRRDRREAAHAQPEAEPSAEATVARLALQREITLLVLELAEPYRTTIVLRFHDELSAREIAERTRTSEPNVRKRLERALEMLRARLAQEKGGEWRGALAPLALGAPFEPALAAGVSAMLAKKAIVALAAVVLVAGSLATLLWPDSVELAGLRSEERHAAVVEKPSRAEEPDGNRVPIRDEVRSGPLLGRACDPQGAPLADILVELEPSGPSARTGTDGRFVLAAGAASGLLRAGRDHVTLVGWEVIAGAVPDGEALVVAAPARKGRVEVHDPSGRALDRVTCRVEVEMRGSVNRELARKGARLLGPATQPQTDARGAAELALPACALELVFERVGYQTKRVRLGASSDPLPDRIESEIAEPGLELARIAVGGQTLQVGQLLPASCEPNGMHVTLEPIKLQRCKVTGRVLTQQGAPVAGALVGFQQWLSVETDAEGRFTLDIDSFLLPYDVHPLVAVKRGFQPAVVRDAVQRLREAPRCELDLELRLGGPPLTIRGQVVRADGTPVPDALVFPWMSDDLGEGLVTPEECSLPLDAPAMSTGLVMRRAAARTAADGSFTLPGLLEREYRLRVLDKAQFFVFTSDAIAAGREGVRIVVPADAERMVRGIVRDRAGNPLAGVEIQAAISPDRLLGGEVATGRSMGSTDDQGRFVTSALPCEARLLVRAEGFAEGVFELRDMSAGEQELVLLRHCAFKLDASTRDRAYVRCELRDARDHAVSIHHDHTRHFGRPERRLSIGADGLSQVMATTEDAETILLVDVDGNLVRKALRLVPGSENVIRL